MIMTAVNKEEDNETLSQEDLDKLISGDELDEPDSGDELDESISGGELDEPDVGGELDEPDFGGELDESISGGELDEPDFGDELDEPISGDELESEIEYAEIPKEKDVKDREKKYKGKNKLFIAAALMLCLLTGAGYFSLQNKKEKAPEAIKLPVMAGHALVFDSFVIPFRDHDKFTYLSLDISFRLMDEELAEEMTAKKELFRGIIYDLLREEVNKTSKLPPLDKLKKYIVEGVNNALSTGKVKEIYIIDFLAV